MSYNGEDMVGMSEGDMKEQDRALFGTVNSLVSCISCKKQEAKSKMRPIREASSRCGSFLCSDCQESEDVENRQIRNLCS